MTAEVITLMCSGCGTGAKCGICGKPIPEQLRRSPDAPSEIRSDCPACRNRQQHNHQS